MSKNTIVFYHSSCLDGFAAAFAVYYTFGESADYVALDHKKDKERVSEEIRKGWYRGRRVIVLDYSFDRDTTEILKKDAAEFRSKFYWIDHHKSAIDSYTGTPDTVRCEETEHYWSILLDTRQCGALLAWEFFNEDCPTPLIFKYIDDYDRWEFKYQDTRAINKGIWQAYPWKLEDGYTLLCSKNIATYKEIGGVIQATHEQHVKRAISESIVECCVNSRKGLSVNAPPNLASDVGHILAHNCGTFGMVWHMTERKTIKVSLRSEGDFDVAKLAESFGGGGHMHAAGGEVSLSKFLEFINAR